MPKHGSLYSTPQTEPRPLLQAGTIGQGQNGSLSFQVNFWVLFCRGRGGIAVVGVFYNTLALSIYVCIYTQNMQV